MFNSHKKIRFAFLMLISFVYQVFYGCQSTSGYSYSWDTYNFPLHEYKSERQKLVDITEDILLRHGFMIDEKNDFESGYEGLLITKWNTDQAVNTLSSHVGYRLRIRVLITEDTEKFEGAQNDPNTQPYLEYLESSEDEQQKIIFGVSVEKEKNTAIPRFLGDLENAQWEPESNDEDYAAGLHYEIRQKFNKISKNQKQGDGYASDMTTKIMELEGKKPDEKKDVNKDDSSYDDLFKKKE